jgi:hypothetical protein
MAQVDVGAAGVEAHLKAQGAARLQQADELFTRDDAVNAAVNDPV